MSGEPHSCWGCGQLWPLPSPGLAERASGAETRRPAAPPAPRRHAGPSAIRGTAQRQWAGKGAKGTVVFECPARDTVGVSHSSSTQSSTLTYTVKRLFRPVIPLWMILAALRGSATQGTRLCLTKTQPAVYPGAGGEGTADSAELQVGHERRDVAHGVAGCLGDEQSVTASRHWGPAVTIGQGGATILRLQQSLKPQAHTLQGTFRSQRRVDA